MAHAFVLIDAAANTAQGLVDQLRSLGAVEEAHVVAGDFDVVAELTAEEVYGLLSTVTGEIRPIDGVGTTRTYVVIE